MNIPDNVRIGGVNYMVLRGSVPTGIKVKSLYGSIDFHNTEINIDFDLSDQAAEESFIHSVTIGIMHHAGINVDLNDDIARYMAYVLYQVIKDNPNMFIDENMGCGETQDGITENIISCTDQGPFTIPLEDKKEPEEKKPSRDSALCQLPTT